MVCIFVKSGLFGRSKSLASPEVCSKLHVSVQVTRWGERTLFLSFEGGSYI